MTIKSRISLLTLSLGMGGTERFVSLLLPKLVEHYDVTLVVFYDNIFFEIPRDVKLIVLNPNDSKPRSLIYKIIGFYSLFKKYETFVKDNSIQISISLLAIPNFINSLLSIRNKNIKTIISERCYPSLMYKDNKGQMVLAKLFFPVLYNKNHVLFSNSEYINLDLKKNFGVKLPMKVIHNPIEINDSEKLDMKRIMHTNSLKIINVGTIYSPKNQKLIIEAMALSKSRDLELTILGDGELKQDLHSLAEELKLSDYLTLKGKVTNVKSYLVKSDCFVLSSNTEGFPNVLLEALSVGLPSISTNCMSGPLEILNNNKPVSINAGEFFRAKYGILINVGDKIGLHNALVHLKNNPSERVYYSRQALERAKDYSLLKVYNQVKRLIID